MVDVYSDCYGPCEAMVPILRKTKNDLPPDSIEILNFAIVSPPP